LKELKESHITFHSKLLFRLALNIHIEQLNEEKMEELSLEEAEKKVHEPTIV
jgi:hypothetical protein